jgi:fructose-1,6-bisphosphatase/inositol monophosphatase family enzyme
MDPDLEVAPHLADRADAITMDHFGHSGLAVRQKPDGTPVTNADLATEELLTAILTERRSADGVLGEERGGRSMPDGRVWVLDPIGGTKNFLRGVPVWARLISLAVDGEPVLGVASAPALGAAGEAHRVPVRMGLARELRVSGVTELGDSYLSTTFSTEVVGSDLTYHAALSPVFALGASVRVADIDGETRCIDPASVAERITERTRVVTAVHQWGHPCDLDALPELRERQDFRLLEDCSHAHGSTWRGRPVGTFGDAAVFSLQTNKAVFAGEGGILATSDERVQDRAVLLGHVPGPGRRPGVAAVLGHRVRPQTAHVAVQRDRCAELAGRLPRADAAAARLPEPPQRRPPRGVLCRTRGHPGAARGERRSRGAVGPAAVHMASARVRRVGDLERWHGACRHPVRLSRVEVARTEQLDRRIGTSLTKLIAETGAAVAGENGFRSVVPALSEQVASTREPP